jgi:hypothetical protein
MIAIATALGTVAGFGSGVFCRLVVRRSAAVEN